MTLIKLQKKEVESTLEPLPSSQRLSGLLMKKHPGKGMGWQKRFFTVTADHKLVYCKPDGDKVLGEIPLSTIISVRPSTDESFAVYKRERILQVETQNRIFFLEAPSVEEKDYWINGLRKVCPQIVQQMAEKELAKAVDTDTALSNDVLFAEIDDVLEGYLFKKSPGLLASWQKRWFSVKGSSIFYYTWQKAQRPQDKIDFADITQIVDAVQSATNEITPKECLLSFLVKTPGRVYFLMAETAEEKEKWLKGLEEKRKDLEPEPDSDGEQEDDEPTEDEQSTVIEDDQNTQPGNTTENEEIKQQSTVLLSTESSRQLLIGRDRVPSAFASTAAKPTSIPNEDAKQSVAPIEIVQPTPQENKTVEETSQTTPQITIEETGGQTNEGSSAEPAVKENAPKKKVVKQTKPKKTNLLASLGINDINDPDTEQV
jgi:hypothetical protein